jgi:hypothetical protein
MNKDFWGKRVWCFIHSVAKGYKPENAKSFKNFMYSLTGLLPCPECRKHLITNLRTLELDQDYLSNPNKLFLWTFLLHDIVNKQLGKASPSFDLVNNFYNEKIADRKFWGKCIWESIHCMAAIYKPEYKYYFKQLIFSLPGILPCDDCRQHLINNLKILPLTDEYLSNNHSLFLWTFLLHDLVNKQLGKISPPFEKIKSFYFNENFCADCAKK